MDTFTFGLFSGHEIGRRTVKKWDRVRKYTHTVDDKVHTAKVCTTRVAIGVPCKNRHTSRLTLYKPSAICHFYQ